MLWSGRQRFRQRDEKCTFSDEAETVDPRCIARALKCWTIEVGSTRKDLIVLTAMQIRFDNTQTALLKELRAIHSQQMRMNSGLSKVEDRF